MTIYIGADHRGFKLKEKIKPWLIEKGFQVEDCGNSRYDPDDDYPDFAAAVAKMVQQTASNAASTGEGARGIVICGSAMGVTIAANKFRGIRCGVGINSQDVHHGRTNDNINILGLSADYVDEKDSYEMTKVFLTTPFSHEERHVRRLKKIEQLEERGQ